MEPGISGDLNQRHLRDARPPFRVGDLLFDAEFVDDVIARFLNREYEPDGKGGLFTIKNCNHDLRTVEIWRQLSWYLGSIM